MNGYSNELVNTPRKRLDSRRIGQKGRQSPGIGVLRAIYHVYSFSLSLSPPPSLYLSLSPGSPFHNRVWQIVHSIHLGFFLVAWEDPWNSSPPLPPRDKGNQTTRSTIVRAWHGHKQGNRILCCTGTRCGPSFSGMETILSCPLHRRSVVEPPLCRFTSRTVETTLRRCGCASTKH